MKKVLIYILLILSLVSCGLLHKSNNHKDPVEPTNFFMQTMIECMFSYTQLDSLCTADHISSNIPDWTKMLFVNGETGEPYEQYLYLVSKGDTTFIYNVIPNKDSIFVQKRIQIEN